jgi:hypothetical protein
MEASPSRSPLPPGFILTRTLCLVVLLLMGVAMAYGAWIAIRNLGRIGV